MPNVDPDKNPIREILEESNQLAFPESEHDVLQAIASYHGVPYLAKGKCECWEGYKRVPGTKPCAPGSCVKCDEHRKTSAGKFNENDPFADEPSLEDLAAIEDAPVEYDPELLPSDQPAPAIPKAVNIQKWQEPLPEYSPTGEALTSPAGPGEPSKATGGEAPFSWRTITPSEGGKTVELNSGKNIAITLDGNNVTSIDGLTPENASSFTPEQVAAAIILVNQSLKDPSGPIGLGEFQSIIDQYISQNPKIGEDIAHALEVGSTASRGVTPAVEGESIEGKGTRGNEDAFIQRLLKEDIARGNAPSLSYEDLIQRAAKAQQALQSGGFVDPIDKNALILFVNYKKIYQREVEDQASGGSSEVRQIAEPRIGAGDKKDTPSPKAAEAVFKALEENNHEQAHELMGHTDCPMGCETDNEGVCRHGYMSAGRTRVVFLDEDIRRSNVHTADFWDDALSAGKGALQAMPLGPAIQQGVENLGQGVENIGQVADSFADKFTQGFGGASPDPQVLQHIQDTQKQNDLQNWVNQQQQQGTVVPLPVPGYDDKGNYVGPNQNTQKGGSAKNSNEISPLDHEKTECPKCHNPHATVEYVRVNEVNGPEIWEEYNCPECGKFEDNFSSY